MDGAESDLEYPVEFDRVSKARFNALNLVNAEMIEELASSSEQRVSESEKFQRDIERIEKYVAQKKETTVSLNRDEFLKRRAELDAEREEERLIEDQVNYSNAEIKRDYYMDEVLDIAVDYIRKLSDTPLAQNDR